MKSFYKGYSTLLLFILLISTIQGFSQIYSTSLGGDWGNPDTWIGSVVPGASDNVVVTATVNCGDNHCNNLTITSTGVIRNDYYTGYLHVNGDITNNGAIVNYSSAMNIYLKGGIINNGTWTNSYTYLEGASNQNIICLNGNSFNGYQFINSKTAGTVYFDTEVYFYNVQVYFGGNSADILSNSTLKMYNAFLHNCSLSGNGSSSVFYGEGATNSEAPYLQDVNLNNLSINGLTNIYYGCSTSGTVYNDGILQNEYYQVSFVTQDNFINNGTLRNYTSAFIFQIYGNFTNNNIVDNHALDFYGSAIQEIVLASGKIFSPTYWTSFKDGGYFEALTDLYFDNVAIDLSEDTLYVQDNGLVHLNDGHLYSGVIIAHESAKSGMFTYHSENGAVSYNIDFINATLTGHFLCDNLVNFYETTTNNALFENNYYGYTPGLYDHFINNGTIQNWASSLILNIYGDFTNNGTIENHAMDFRGTTDQSITLQNGKTLSPSYFTSIKPSGNFIALTDLYFDHVTVNLDNDVLILQENGKISLTGGRLHQAEIHDMNDGSGNLQLHLTDNAYIDYCTVYSPEILGKCDIGYANVFMDEIIVTDTMQNDYFGYTLDIDGNITNNGIIQNYSSGLTLNINGNITNNGTWTNSPTKLNGTTDQHVTCLNGNNFGGYQFFNLNSSGTVFFNDEVNFNNCQLKGEGNAFEVSASSSLNLYKGFVDFCNLHGNGETSTLFGDGPAYNDMPYLYHVTMNDLRYTGAWDFNNGNVLDGTVINDAILQNDYYSYSVEVNADFINNGTIRNYTSGLTMKIYGNITNNGFWGAHAIDFYGAADQYITLEDGYNFTPTYITSFKPSGQIIATTDLLFIDTKINLDNDQLIMPENALLSIDEEYLYQANVEAASGKFELFMANNAYMHNCTIGNVDLYGVIDLNTGNTFDGTTTIFGLIQNDYYQYSVDFIGDLINNGTIDNHVSGLVINAHANITNNGTWDNYITNMIGTNEQHVYLTDDHWIDGQMRFVSDITGTAYQWYWNNWSIENPPYPNPAIISGETSSTLTWISPVTDSWAGTYKCWVDGSWSRNIIIEENTNLRLDITAFLEGPFNGTIMNADLNPIIPLHQSLDIIGYNGPETVTEIPNTDIVDWIGVELRDAADASLATEATTIGGGAFFIRNDGKIVGLDGSSVLSFDLTINQNLYVLLWHRNHLPVMTMTAVPQSGGIYTYDFTTAANQAYANNQSDLGGGKFGMIGGNANGDGIIDEFDGIEKWINYVGMTGYLQGDVNMDTQVDNKDKNDIWFGNQGKSEILP